MRPAAPEPDDDLAKPFRLRGAIADAYMCRDREVVLESGAGTGKSFGWLVKARDTGQDYPGARILFLRKTRRSLNVVLEDWESEVLGRGHPAINGTAHYTHRDFYKHPNGTEWWLGGLDNPDKVMSSKWDRIVVFEATDATLRDHEQLLTRLRSFKTPYHQICLDCNPSRTTHWINVRAAQPYVVPKHLAEFLPPARPGQTQITRLQARHQDNPLLWDNDACTWTPEGAEYMATLEALTGHRRLRLLEHKWVSAEGLIWPELDRARHVVLGRLEKLDDGAWAIVTHKAEPIRLVSFAAGGDQGMRNAGALGLFGFDGHGTAYLVREVYHTQRGIEWWGDWVEKWHKAYRLRWLAYDPARPDYIDYFNDRLGSRGGRTGVPRLVRGALNTWEVGRDEVGHRLAQGQLMFLPPDETLEHPRDPELVAAYEPSCVLESMESYVYKPQREQAGDMTPDAPEGPLKKADHGSDLCRYFTVEAFTRKNVPSEAPFTPAPGTIAHALGWKDVMRRSRRRV